MSEDGWTWNGGAVRPGGGAAPDILKIGDRYLVVYGSIQNRRILNIRRLSWLPHLMVLRTMIL